MPLSNSFEWKKTNQTRLSLLVDKAIDTVLKPPREVEEIDLSDWSARTENGKNFVVRVDGLKCAFHAGKVPANLDNLFPILLGTVKGHTIVLDGAHRIAALKAAKRKTIPGFTLSEAETLACARKGLEHRVIEAIDEAFPSGL